MWKMVKKPLIFDRIVAYWMWVMAQRKSTRGLLRLPVAAIAGCSRELSVTGAMAGRQSFLFGGWRMIRREDVPIFILCLVSFIILATFGASVMGLM